jgi:polysaccharide biosynthesis transport protein
MYQSRLGLKDNLIHIDESAQTSPNISRLISAMRRHTILFTAFCLAGVALGAFYQMTATPLYTASVNVAIDNSQVRAVGAVGAVSKPSDLSSPDNGEVESRAAILRSEKLGLAVVEHLNLSEDPAFVEPTLMEKIWAPIMVKLGATTGPAHPLNDADPGLNRKLTALKTLNRNLLISRVGRTSVLQIDYTSPNPVRAAKIANAYTDVYLSEQLNSRVEGTHRARSWLQQRTEELRQLSSSADLAAQKFKAGHNLLATRGTLISEQQLNEMTTELVSDRAATEQAHARYLHIKNIIDTHQTESAVTESLANPVINQLRTQYLDAAKRKSDLERKLGPDHITVLNLKNTMGEFSALLFQELGRVAETYKNDYEVAAARENSLANNLAQQKGVAVVANDAQVQLRQLEQNAESYKTLYQNYLQRYQEAAQQESFPIVDMNMDMHVISAATPPLAPSYPRAPNVLAISLALGALAGAVVARLRESMDRVFRTIEQVRDELGVDVLGMLPALSGTSFPQHVQDTVAPILRYVIDNPFSAFAETLRSAKGAADLALQKRSPKIIGLVSLLPKEGKSTVAKNFASLLALQGTKTLLIDADMRHPVLTRAMGYERGQVLQTDRFLPPLAELLKCEPDSGLQVLPCIYARDDPRVADGLTSGMLNALFQSSDQSFEYVVIDFPPIGPVVNARCMASVIDAFIFVVEWGMTSRGAVHAALSKEHSIKEKLLGVILNKVDMKKLKIYEHFGSDGYYHQHYENYYKHAE